MKRLEIFEDYFVNIYKKFGVCKIRVEGDKVNLEEKDLKKMIFGASDFNAEYNRLIYHCRQVYKHIQHGFLLIIKQDFGNNYYVLIND